MISLKLEEVLSQQVPYLYLIFLLSVQHIYVSLLVGGGVVLDPIKPQQKMCMPLLISCITFYAGEPKLLQRRQQKFNAVIAVIYT
jgi:hypothetical protein